MLSAIDPMIITSIIVGVAFVGSIFGVARRSRAQPAPDRTTLPAGADAALWSITEVLPDPRNHLAIKDPTSELRLTDRERAAAHAAAPGAASAPRPADAARSAQSLAARRAALAKRAVPGVASPALPTVASPAVATTAVASPAVATAPVVEPAMTPGSLTPDQPVAVPVDVNAEPDVVRAAASNEPLVIFLEEAAAVDERRLALLPEDLPLFESPTVADPVVTGADLALPRWGESPARAS